MNGVILPLNCRSSSVLGQTSNTFSQIHLPLMPTRAVAAKFSPMHTATRHDDGSVCALCADYEGRLTLPHSSSSPSGCSRPRPRRVSGSILFRRVSTQMDCRMTFDIGNGTNPALLLRQASPTGQTSDAHTPGYEIRGPRAEKPDSAPALLTGLSVRSDSRDDFDEP